MNRTVQKFLSKRISRGGVLVSYRDINHSFNPIGIFTPYQELNSIKEKVQPFTALSNFSHIIYPYSGYSFSDLFWNDYPQLKQEIEYISNNRNKLSLEEKKGKLSNLRILTTNIFELLPLFFLEEEPNDNENYIQIYGRFDNERTYRYVNKKYINCPDNLNYYKIFIPSSNGCGSIGEVLSTPVIGHPVIGHPVIGHPVIGHPVIGHTQTFISVGKFETLQEAENCLKYIMSKFARCLLGILKITQHNPPEKWKYVPLQDFTENSDIDWSKSIPEIDKQLYEKYGLSEEEISFIETHVKEME